MKTIKEFIEKLNSDPAFAEEVGAKVNERIEAGEQDYKAIWLPIVKEYGYEVTGEELDKLNDDASSALSDEELGKVSGGSSPLCITASLLATVSVVSLSAKLIFDA